jgi:hypothetical protein
MLVYLKAKVVVKVRGISGGFNETISALVNGTNSVAEAKGKFEATVRRNKAHTLPDSINFEYIEVAPEI